MGIAEWLGIGKTIKDGADGIGGLVETTVSSITGELKPADKAKIESMKIELTTKLEELSLQGSKQFYNFMIQYEGKAEDVPKVVQIARSLVRPITTYFFLGLLMIAVGIDFYNVLFQEAKSFILLSTIPQELWWLIIAVFSFWFAGRTGEKVADRFLNKNAPAEEPGQN